MSKFESKMQVFFAVAFIASAALELGGVPSAVILPVVAVLGILAAPAYKPTGDRQ